jgi:hypothetical protein
VPESFVYSAAPYPLRILEPVASQRAQELTDYSWWGRTYLHIREGDERQRHLQSLMLGIELELKAIDERKSKLMGEKSAMETTMKMFEDMQGRLRAAQESEHSLRKEVSEMQANPVVRGGLIYHSKMSQAGHYRGRRSISEHRRSSSQEIAEPPPVQQSERPRLCIEGDSSDDDISEAAETTRTGEPENLSGTGEQETVSVVQEEQGDEED